MSLTGTNADHRFAIRPSRMAALAFSLASALHDKGVGVSGGHRRRGAEAVRARDGGQGFRRAGAPGAGPRRGPPQGGKASLVLTGEGLPAEAHAACHLLNSMLGAEGNTVDSAVAAGPIELSTLAEVAGVLKEAAGGAFAAAIFWGGNPAHAFPDPAVWKAAVAGIPLGIRIGSPWTRRPGIAGCPCPRTTARIVGGPSAGGGPPQPPAADHRASPRHPSGGGCAPRHPPRAEGFRRGELPRGTEGALAGRGVGQGQPGALRAVLERSPPRWRAPARRAAPAGAGPQGGGHLRGRGRAAGPRVEGMELVLSPSAALLDGRYANNGWLQELPTP